MAAFFLFALGIGRKESKDVMVKVVIKWAQGHACMNYAEREQARRSQGGGELD